MNRLILFLSLGLLAFQGSLQAQDPAASIQTRFDNYRNRILQEKIFVHTDKSFYLAGEVLWCKLWCVDGSSHKPLDLSRVAYIELLNKDNKPEVQGKLHLANGEGNGSFYLPPSLNSGYYRLRAYTSWMKNMGPEYFFEETITVVNTLKGLSATRPAAKKDSGITASPGFHPAFSGHLGLFPEGGNLVNGLRSRIAFEISGYREDVTAAQGCVINEEKDTLLRFQPSQDGRGTFRLTPSGGHTYTACILFPDGSLASQALPPAFDQGAVLTVEEAGQDQLAIHAYVRGGQLAGAGELLLFIHTSSRTGASSLTERIKLSSDSAVYLLDKKRLGEGTNQLTLFSPAGTPLCQRLYWMPPHETLDIEASTDLPSYGTRNKVSLSLLAKEGNGQVVPASLSMAVYRLDSLQALPQEDILSWLWLGSELKGVTTPHDLFEKGIDRSIAMDNLMLTHGWRRYRWEDIFSHTDSNYYPPEHHGQLVAGRLTDARTGLPAKDVTVFISVPGIKYQFANARTDAQGKFLADLKDFYGSGSILVQTNTFDSSYKIEIFTPYSELYTRDPLPVLRLSDTLQKSLAEHSVGMQVQNVYSGDSLRRFSPPAIDSFRFYGRPDYTYQLDDYTRFTTMEEVLREYVREINVNHEQGHLHVLMLNEPIRQFFDDNNTLVLLDGIPVPDDKIFNYDPLKVKTLEIVPRQYLLGTSSFSGIASFTTYKGDYEGLEMDARSLLIDYDGWQLRREFYSPVYGTPQQVESRMPDFRNVLYWAPDIHTDRQGQKEFSFYTSDIPGRYVAVIQGLTADGQAAVKYLPFEVK